MLGIIAVQENFYVVRGKTSTEECESEDFAIDFILAEASRTERREENSGKFSFALVYLVKVSLKSGRKTDLLS